VNDVEICSDELGTKLRRGSTSCVVHVDVRQLAFDISAAIEHRHRARMRIVHHGSDSGSVHSRIRGCRLMRYGWNFSVIFYGIIPSNPVASLAIAR
jgi:hypothetical protein